MWWRGWAPVGRQQVRRPRRRWWPNRALGEGFGSRRSWRSSPWRWSSVTAVRAPPVLACTRSRTASLQRYQRGTARPSSTLAGGGSIHLASSATEMLNVGSKRSSAAPAGFAAGADSARGIPDSLYDSCTAAATRRVRQHFLPSSSARLSRRRAALALTAAPEHNVHALGQLPRRPATAVPRCRSVGSLMGRHGRWLSPGNGKCLPKARRRNSNPISAATWSSQNAGNRWFSPPLRYSYLRAQPSAVVH